MKTFLHVTANVGKQAVVNIDLCNFFDDVLLQSIDCVGSAGENSILENSPECEVEQSQVWGVGPPFCRPPRRSIQLRKWWSKKFWMRRPKWQGAP